MVIGLMLSSQAAQTIQKAPSQTPQITISELSYNDTRLTTRIALSSTTPQEVRIQALSSSESWKGSCTTYISGKRINGGIKINKQPSEISIECQAPWADLGMPLAPAGSALRININIEAKTTTQRTVSTEMPRVIRLEGDGDRTGPAVAGTSWEAVHVLRNTGNISIEPSRILLNTVTAMLDPKGQFQEDSIPRFYNAQGPAGSQESDDLQFAASHVLTGGLAPGEQIRIVMTAYPPRWIAIGSEIATAIYLQPISERPGELILRGAGGLISTSKFRIESSR